MSDPFFGLNLNNLQTISATNNTRLHEMNHSITKPLMSSHLPQLPQQQMKTITANSKSETTDEELDERKKFEKYRKFQIQQKRLQEMSFSKTVPTNSNSSADKLMANLIQKVESEAKLDKRINNSHKSVLHNYNQPTVHSSMATNIALNSGTSHLPNTSSYINQYASVDQMSQMMPSMYMTGQQLPQQPNNYFNSFYPSNQMQKTAVQQMTNSGLETPNYFSVAADFDGTNRYNSLPPINSTQSMSFSTIPNFNANSDPIFSITATNGIQTGVTHSNREPICSVISPNVVQKLPNCFEDLSKIPALYIKVWNYVKTNDITNICDTNRLYPVLLSVGLPQTILAKLWSIVNQTIPGQLTRHELNKALALIALIQKSSPNPLEEVYKLDSLPVPNIQFFDESTEGKASFQVLQITTEVEVKPLSEPTFGSNNFEQKNSNQMTNDFDFSQISHKNEQNSQNLCQNSYKPVIEDKTDDDFDDFKSADFSCISTVTELTAKQLPKTTATETAVNNRTEEEFDDFKSVTFDDINLSALSRESTKSPNYMKSNTLSDALISNISAISSSFSSHTTSPTPVVTSSTMNTMHSSTDYFQNTLGSGPQSEDTTEQMTKLNPNFGSVDKYSVFRELSTQTPKDDDFGNFLSHTTNCDAESVDSLKFGHHENSDNNDSIESISHHIIQTCRQIIHKTFNVLVVNHGEDSVLEAIRSTEGNKFAFDLSEVYAIVKRVETNLKTSDKLNNQLIKLIEDIDKTWNSIGSVFSKASINIEFKDDNSGEKNTNSSHCAICCSKPSAERPVLTFAGFEYHISCANLWLNCINPTLPQPLNNCR